MSASEKVSCRQNKLHFTFLQSKCHRFSCIVFRGPIERDSEGIADRTRNQLIF